jgi:hypothetical protein
MGQHLGHVPIPLGLGSWGYILLCIAIQLLKLQALQLSD